MKQTTIRSLLFAPANRPELLAKFPRLQADCFVIDLEDGTHPRHKVAARDGLAANVQRLRESGFRASLYVRVNEISTPLYEDDMRAAAACEIDGIVLPKLTHADEVRSVLDLADKLSRRSKLALIGGVESMDGVQNVPGFGGGARRHRDRFAGADERLIAMYFGAEDYATDLGIERTQGNEEVAYARARIAIAARARGKIPIDQAVAQLRDLERMRADSRQGKGLGFGGKICVTPDQVKVANEVFAPTSDEVSDAQKLLEAYRLGEEAGEELIVFEGKVIVPDGPLVKRASRTLALASDVKKLLQSKPTGT